MEDSKKKHQKKAEKFVEHAPWELEVETEGLDELQGERLEKEPTKKHQSLKA